MVYDLPKIRYECIKIKGFEGINKIKVSHEKRQGMEIKVSHIASQQCSHKIRHRFSYQVSIVQIQLSSFNSSDSVIKFQ